MYIFLYLVVVVFVNLGFSYLPPVHTPLGSVPAMTAFVGLVFVLRDYAQRSSGHYVLLAMGAALVLSWALGDPAVVHASVAAFFVSELADFIFFTITKKPFHKRVLLSSLIAVPLDSLVFMYVLGIINPAALIAMTLSKLIASVVLWAIYEYRGRKELCIDEGCNHHSTPHVCLDSNGRNNGNGK